MTQPAPPIPRGRRVTAAVIVAVLLLAAGIYAAVQAIYLYVHGSPWLLDAPAIADRLHRSSWQDPAVTAAAAVLTVIGLWLLILAVAPAAPTLTALHEPDPSMSTGITPGGMSRTLAAAAQHTDGVSRAEVRLGRGTAATTVITPLRHHEALPGAVSAAVTDRVAQLDPVRGYAVRVRVARRDR
jgi:hypothetical protein